MNKPPIEALREKSECFRYFSHCLMGQGRKEERLVWVCVPRRVHGAGKARKQELEAEDSQGEGVQEVGPG